MALHGDNRARYDHLYAIRWLAKGNIPDHGFRLLPGGIRE
jgi:hypothetical protein